MKLPFILILSLILSASCKTTNSIVEQRKACETVRCTDEFMSVTVRVVDKNDQPVVLESYATSFPGDKTTVRTEKAPDNLYAVVDDGIVKLMPRGKGKFIFQGLE